MDSAAMYNNILCCFVLGVLAAVCSGFQHDRHRHAREAVLSYDAEITTFLDNIRETRALSSLAEVQTKVGDISDYVKDSIKETSNYLRLLTDKEPSDGVTKRATTLVHSIESLGYILGLDMQTDESRRMSIDTVTIYVSNFRTSNFKGLKFSQKGDQSVISIPSTASFPSGTSDVISVSYGVSGVKEIMPKMENNSLGSDVMSTAFFDMSGRLVTLTLYDPVSLEMKFDTSDDGKEPTCTFLEYSDDGSGLWSTTGCDTVYPVNGLARVVQCHCTHLSTYGVILTNKVEVVKIGAAAWVGSSITILFCVLTTLVFIGYRLMHSTRCYIRFSFLTALALAEMFFLCVSYKKSPAICTIVAVGIHFFVMSSFAWLLSYALFLGNDMSGDVEASFHIAHYTFIGWAIPFVVVLISFIWKYDTYVADEYCWIDQAGGLRYAYIIPIGILIVVTLCVLMYDISVHVSITDPKKQDVLKFAKSGLRSCCCLLPVLGAVWILADFVIIEQSMWLQILLSVLNIILGVMIFLIMFCFNEEVAMKRKNGKFKKFRQKFKIAQGNEEDTPKHSTKGMNVVLGGFTHYAAEKESEKPETSRSQSARSAPTRSPLTSPRRSTPSSSATTSSCTDDRARMIPLEGPSSPKRRSYDVSEARYKFFYGEATSGTI